MSDLSVGTSIVDAFQRGNAETQDTLKRKQAAQQFQAQLDQERKLKEEDLAHNQSQFDARMKFEQSVQQIQNLMAQQKIMENVRQTGDLPPDSTPALSGSADGKDVISFYHPIFGDKPVTVQSPLGVANQQAQVNEITQTPVRATEKQKLEEESKANLDLEAARSATQQKVEDMRRAQKQQDDDLAYQRAIAVANIQANAVMNRERRTTSDPLDRPISPEAQMAVYGDVKPDRTLRTMEVTTGKPLSDTEKDKSGGLDALEDKIREVKKTLEAPQADGKSGYENYFKGPLGGMIKTVTKGVSQDSFTAGVKQKLTSIELLANNLIAKRGANLTVNEEKLLKDMAGSSSFLSTPQDAQARVNGFLQDVLNEKANLLKQHAGTGKVSDSKSVLDEIFK